MEASAAFPFDPLSSSNTYGHLSQLSIRCLVLTGLVGYYFIPTRNQPHATDVAW